MTERVAEGVDVVEPLEASSEPLEVPPLDLASEVPPPEFSELDDGLSPSEVGAPPPLDEVWERDPGRLIPPDVELREAVASEVDRPFIAPELWIERINPGGPRGGGGGVIPERGVNCADCARAVEATWRGRPESAALALDGEPWSATLTEDWVGQQFESTSLDLIWDRVREGGPGSSAIVEVMWADGHGGHAFNAINPDGEVRYVDGQSADVSRRPPSLRSIEEARAIVRGPRGERL